MVSAPQLIIYDGSYMPVPLVDIVSSTPQHISALKANLRDEDANEIVRLGATVQHALWQSYRNSLIRKTALINGVVAACWGIHGTFMGKTGVPWLITTPEVRKISPLKFTRIYQQEVIEMLKMFPCLENWVDSEYTNAIRLLEIIGFTIEDPQKIGNGMFRKFWIRG